MFFSSSVTMLYDHRNNNHCQLQNKNFFVLLLPPLHKTISTIKGSQDLGNKIES